MAPAGRQSTLRLRRTVRRSETDPAVFPRRSTRTGHDTAGSLQHRSRGIRRTLALAPTPARTPADRARETPARSKTAAAWRRTTPRTGRDRWPRVLRRWAAPATQRTARTVPADETGGRQERRGTQTVL